MRNSAKDFRVTGTARSLRGALTRDPSHDLNAGDASTAWGMIRAAMTTGPRSPDFRSPQFLRDHIAWMIGFYHPRCIDPRGGYFHYYANDGAFRDRDRRALVSSARMIVSYAMAGRALATDAHLPAIRHGLAFLRDVHRDPRSGAYAWTLGWQDGRWAVLDGTNQAYGFVHVALAYAHALAAGIGEARDYLAEHFELMERRFWDRTHGLYADDAAADWSSLSPYRGQNANMHGCEAWLAAHAASGEARYLERALAIARNVCVRQADRAGGLVWEHYKPDWSVDWTYNKGDFSNGYRPWGFQPGHQTEWTKLLLQLHARRPEAWMLERARVLFDRTWPLAWDARHGGLFYSLEPELSVANAEKYAWVQIESAAAAALLARATGAESYWQRYDELWSYCWRHLVDHERGSWHRSLSRDHARTAPDKGSGGKDYHVIGVCFDVLAAL
jgi:mannose/cellobiose epimerase-like protein (N-acyl-D-glucosamine 2-epimerase family)